MNTHKKCVCVCCWPVELSSPAERVSQKARENLKKKLYPHPNQVELRQWQQVYIYHILHTESSATQGGYYQNVRLRCRLVLSVCVFVCEHL